jgi:glycosyltransferase involved in cell wall biosynthesis
MQIADVFVLPSLRECGGSSAFEAMALGLPVIVTRWGGPGLYVTDECGIRVDPSSREGFVAGLAEAMLRLARDPLLRQRMGEAGVRHASEGIFNWERKIDRFLQIYRDVARARRTG